MLFVTISQDAENLMYYICHSQNSIPYPALAEKNKPLTTEKQEANVVMSQQECYLLIDSSDDDDDFEDLELSEHDVDFSGLDEIDLDETF